MWHLPISAGSVGDSSKKGCQCSCCAGGFVQATAMVTELCRKSEQVFGQQHGGDRWLEALRLPELRVCSGLSHTWLCRGARPSRPTLPGLSAGFASTPLTHPPGIFSSHRDLGKAGRMAGPGCCCPTKSPAVAALFPWQSPRVCGIAGAVAQSTATTPSHTRGVFTPWRAEPCSLPRSCVRLNSSHTGQGETWISTVV